MDVPITVKYNNYIFKKIFLNYMFHFLKSGSKRYLDIFCFLEKSRDDDCGVIYFYVCCFADKVRAIFLQLVEAESTNELIIKCAALNVS